MKEGYIKIANWLCNLFMMRFVITVWQEVFKKTIDIDESINEQNLKVILDKLVYERAVCAEGVIKYIYRDSHNIKTIVYVK